MRSCGRKRELFKACHEATDWLFFFFFSADCEMRWKVFAFCSLTLAACLGENQGKAEVWPNLSRRTIELLGIAFTEARLQGKLVRLWDGTKPHRLDGLSA